ncbi:MAG: HAMP domain-containing histidine kinase [Proteobacteria bacterium]|nr:HAMP domain-containing histidine kinase [Pseudomonadota bacterium]
MRIRLWPGSLAARTTLVLLVGLAFVQAAGLTIHALDQIDLLQFEQARNLAFRVMTIYRTVQLTPPDGRQAVLARLPHGPALSARLQTTPPLVPMPPAPFWLQRLIRVNISMIPMPPQDRPGEVMIRGDPARHQLVLGLLLPGGGWLNVRAVLPPPQPWHSPSFLWAFGLMTLAAAALSLWAVRRLTAPVRTLAEAAEALGRDVNAPALPETGPSEVAAAAAAFNTMAARIRRFVQDRTELLTAIGHDLRTPITRLKLRAEFVEDDEQRRKMLADLDELEQMVAATLAFGRDARTGEPVVPLDLAELLRTVLDEAADARPEMTDSLAYEGPAHLTLRARSLGLKRAFANLTSNAIMYGGGARVRLLAAGADGMVTIEIEDDGPGVPPEQLDLVFEPFHRGEPSRNRETGGVGLGLPIARNILRAHGGDITIANRPGGGLKVTVRLPA